MTMRTFQATAAYYFGMVIVTICWLTWNESPAVLGDDPDCATKTYVADPNNPTIRSRSVSDNVEDDPSNGNSNWTGTFSETDGTCKADVSVELVDESGANGGQTKTVSGTASLNRDYKWNWNGGADCPPRGCKFDWILSGNGSVESSGTISRNIPFAGGSGRVTASGTSTGSGSVTGGFGASANNTNIGGDVSLGGMATLTGSVSASPDNVPTVTASVDTAINTVPGQFTKNATWSISLQNGAGNQGVVGAGGSTILINVITQAQASVTCNATGGPIIGNTVTSLGTAVGTAFMSGGVVNVYVNP